VILHRNTDWLAVDKPEGLASHAGQPGELGAVEWLDLHLDLKAYIVSRLDRGTSGVLLMALNPAASARAQAIHEAGTARKRYEFLSPKDAGRETWVCEDPLDGKAARTEFTRLAAANADGLVHYQAEITRGRKHQIRRHASAGGVPILGDIDYGGAPHGRLCLHCSRVHWPELPEPVTAERPPSFAALLAGGVGRRELGLAICRDRRGDWLPAVTDAWREVHRDEIPGLPVAVDIYGGWFNAVWFDETADDAFVARRLDPVLDRIMKTHRLKGGVVRTHRRNPHQRALITETRVVGDAPPETFAVREHGLRYEINLNTTQHTGLFLDQRDTRRRVAAIAAGRRVTNLFAYTASFSVAAVAAGAEVAFSVDTAKACLNTGKANFSLNDLAEGGRGKFVQSDARKWLQRQQRRRDETPDQWQPLDLVICDPPVFASSKDGGKFAVEKEWPRLAEAAAGLLSARGVAIFANNHRAGDHAIYKRALQDHFTRVLDLRPPLDFPVAPRRPHHVRTFWCTKAD